MTKIIKYIASIFLMLALTLPALSSPKTSFLPMEDGFSSMRAPVCGVSVEKIKPYREILAIETEPTISYSFGSKDILLCLALIGVYYMIQRKNRSRSVGF